MSKINVNEIKEKCICGFETVKDAIDSAKNISIKPKVNASLCIKSRKNNSSYCDKKLSVDTEFSLFKVICICLAAVAALAAASLMVNSLFSGCCKKQKSKTLNKNDSSQD